MSSHHSPCPSPHAVPRKKSARNAFILGGVLALAFGVAWALGRPNDFGWLLMGAFWALSFACGRTEVLKSLSYTMLILGLVVLAMCYPGPLQGYGDVKYMTFIPAFLQLIMFGVGSQMSVKDFEGVIKTPKAVGVGLLAQMTVMPLTGFALASMVDFDGARIAVALGLAQPGQIDPAQAKALSGAIGAGIVLIGCSPSGLASNVMCFLARGNLALSVTVAACATMLAPVMTPLRMKLLAGTMVEVHVVAMMHDVIRMLVYPIFAGLLFNALATAKPWKAWRREWAFFAACIVLLQVTVGLLAGHAATEIAESIGWTALFVLILAPLLGKGINRLTGGNADIVRRLMGRFSMAAICLILTVITAANRESLMAIGLLMIAVMFVHNLSGYCCGYVIARLFRLDDRSCRTLAIETGQQNGGLANGLAASLPIEPALRALMGIAPAVFGAIQNITGSVLATWWRRIPYRDETSIVEENAAEHPQRDANLSDAKEQA